MKRIFICSPYRGDTVWNTTVARLLCRKAIREGHAPFAPHLFYPTMLDDSNAEQRALGMRLAKTWLEAADVVWCLNVPPSEGMRREVAFAKALDIPVVYVNAPTQLEVELDNGGVKV